MQELMVGPGWGPANAWLVNGIYHGPICLPIPINTVYVGFGNQDFFLRPSPWCNPLVYFTEDGQEANWIFAQFGRSRADRVQWLSPISGTQLACDCSRSKCHVAVLDELIRELATSGAMANEGWEFSGAPFGGNSIPDSTGAPSWYASYPSSVRNKTHSAWPESWTGLCIEMRSFQCRCFCNMLPDNFSFVTILQTGGVGSGLVAGYQSQTGFQLAKPFIFRSGRGFVAVLNLPPLDVTIRVKLAQSQQRVEGYWIWIQSQSTATSVWDQAEVQCLFRDAHRVGRSTCLDGAPWSLNNEIVSNHCSILSLGGICAHKFHSGMSPGVNFWSFVASSFWQRFSCKLAGVWDWAQQMVLERLCVYIAGMLSPPGQSLEQFLHKTHFHPSGARPISGVARKVGSAMQPVRRAVLQLIPEGLGTHFHLAVARDIEHPFLRPPTTYNPVVLLLDAPYSRSEIAPLNGWMSLKPYRSWRMLYILKTCTPCVWWTLSFFQWWQGETFS